MMNMTNHDRLYIRSSLVNSMWNADGTKSDIIAVIPLESAIDSVIKEYRPPGESGRHYETKETVTGASSFSIRITDDEDNLIEFITDYEL